MGIKGVTRFTPFFSLMIEVKKIYMDLKEAKKDQGRDVWVLESELFKDPITLQLEYSDHDKERMDATKQ